MKPTRLLWPLFVLFSTMPVYADSLLGVFNVENGSIGNTIGGQIYFTLNNNGTIDASLYSAFSPIVGFGYNAPTYRYTGSQFLPEDAAYTTTAWTSAYGIYRSGIYWTDQSSPPPQSINWTIGNPGEFSSVWQALGGDAQYDFVLFPKNTIVPIQWAASAVAVSPIPEADIYSLMVFGLGVLSLVLRHRQVEQSGI